MTINERTLMRQFIVSNPESAANFIAKLSSDYIRRVGADKAVNDSIQNGVSIDPDFEYLPKTQEVNSPNLGYPMALSEAVDAMGETITWLAIHNIIERRR